MLIHALATDYDGTLATLGVVADATLEALRRLKASDRKLIMVTGRRLPDLMGVCPHLDLFDAVVAENGALLYWPELREERLLGDPPPAAFLAALRARHVTPLAVGRSIIATLESEAPAVLEAIHECGIEWQIIYNKESVMCLSPGVNKASGLMAALQVLAIPPTEVAAIGDAENDQSLLAACGLSVAVANALPTLKADADLVAVGAEGAGVTWLIDRLLNDPASLTTERRRTA